MPLYFLTGNKGKLLEVQSMIEDVEALDIDLPEIQEVDAHKIIKAKLKEAQNHHKGQFIVEDTSLYFEALNGLPGPLVKWFLETVGNEGLYKMIQPYGNFTAEATTIVGYSDSKGEIQFFEGSIKGSIVTPRGDGFGWNPIFLPDGYIKTFGELTSEEGSSFGMRKIAIDKLKEFLRK